MASTINATTTAGVAITPDNSGILTLQNNGVAIPMVKAYVNFNSNGTINSSYNVTSVSNISTGVYQITFTTAFANANYCPIISNAFQSGVTEAVSGVVYNDVPYAPTTTVLTVVFHNTSSTARVNPTFGYVAVIA